MKDKLDTYTGTIGVGCLFSLGLFFITNSQYSYWQQVEELMSTKSWSIIISIPLLIINYIIGLVTIEISEVLMPKLFKKNLQVQFQKAFQRVLRLNNDFVSSRYNEINQNKRLLDGSALSFILVGIGLFLQSLDNSAELSIVGFIGMIGSFLASIICPLISLRIQREFNNVLNQEVLLV